MTLQKPICNSGAAKGADETFGRAATAAGHVVRHFSFAEHKAVEDCGTRIILAPETLRSADPALREAAKVLGRRFPCRSPYVNNLLRRNYSQVSDAERVYAVTAIDAPNWIVLTMGVFRRPIAQGNVQFKRRLVAERKATIIADTKATLSLTEQVEFEQKAKDVRFTNVGEFSAQLKTLKESYFGPRKATKAATVPAEAGQPGFLAEATNDPGKRADPIVDAALDRARRMAGPIRK